MRNEPRIVEFTNDYQPRVKALVVGIHEEFGFLYDFKLDFDLEDPIRYYTSAGGVFYVLLNGEDVIGTVAVKKIDERVVELKRMYLLPEYRGQGWGARLLEQALAFCREKGFKSCVLDTNTKQESAQRLYASYGFETYKQEKNDLFMRLDLT